MIACTKRWQGLCVRGAGNARFRYQRGHVGMGSHIKGGICHLNPGWRDGSPAERSHFRSRALFNGNRVPIGQVLEAPRSAGPRAYGLRVCRPTLGPGLPAHGIVVVDPDRFPSPGGIAAVREADGLRLLIVTADRQGRMIGYSTHPDREVELDMIDPADVGTVIGVLLD